MSSTLPALILETLIGRLALLFLASAHGDLAAARDAARRMLAAYQPETPDELALAAEIINFSFHAMEALSQAAAPGLPLNRILRLRGSAVSLSRESHKSQRKLDQLQKARRAGQLMPAQAEPPTTEPSPAEPAQPRPAIDKAIATVEAERQTPTVQATPVQATPAQAPTVQAKASAQPWTRSFQQIQAARRITENLKQNQARHQAQAATPAG